MLVLWKFRLYRHFRLVLNAEELKAIIKRLESKRFTRNWRDPSECQEVAKEGRELAKWATSSSTTAVVPVKDIVTAMNNLGAIMGMLTENNQSQFGKSMMQDLVEKLTNQINPTLQELAIAILLLYADICAGTGDIEEEVEICKKGINLTAGSQKYLSTKLFFHIRLGESYINLRNATQADKELRDARNCLPTVDESEKELRGARNCLSTVDESKILEIERANSMASYDYIGYRKFSDMITSLEGKSFQLLQNQLCHGR